MGLCVSVYTIIDAKNLLTRSRAQSSGTGAQSHIPASLTIAPAHPPSTPAASSRGLGNDRRGDAGEMEGHESTGRSISTSISSLDRREALESASKTAVKASKTGEGAVQEEGRGGGEAFGMSGGGMGESDDDLVVTGHEVLIAITAESALGRAGGV